MNFLEGRHNFIEFSKSRMCQNAEKIITENVYSRNDEIPENGKLPNFQISKNNKLPNIQIPANSTYIDEF